MLAEIGKGWKPGGHQKKLRGASSWLVWVGLRCGVFADRQGGTLEPEVDDVLPSVPCRVPRRFHRVRRLPCSPVRWIAADGDRRSVRPDHWPRGRAGNE